MSASTTSSVLTGIAAGIFAGLLIGVLAYMGVARPGMLLSAGGALGGGGEPGSDVDPRLLGDWMVLVDGRIESGAGQATLTTERAAYDTLARGAASRFGSSFRPNQAVLRHPELPENREAMLVNVFETADGKTTLLTSDDFGVGLALRPNPDVPDSWRTATGGRGGGFLGLDEIAFVRPAAAGSTTPTVTGPISAQAARKAVTNNLRQIVSAAQMYMLDKGVTEAAFTDLAGTGADAYIRTVTPVAGERYDFIIINQTDSQISVDVPGTGVVMYSF